MKLPPPYSYDLAVSINPNWENLDWMRPWTCAGSQHKLLRVGACDKDPVWWHPFIVQDNSYCDDCCPAFQKRIITAYWQETKLTTVTNYLFDVQPLKTITSKLKLDDPKTRAELGNLIESFTFHYYEFKVYSLSKIATTLIDKITWAFEQKHHDRDK